MRAPAKRLPRETGVVGSNPTPSAIGTDKMKNLYYEVPHFKLYLDNCLNVITEIPEESIDMIFADPPYFLSNGTFTCQNGKRASVRKGTWDLSSGLKNSFGFQP